MKRLIFFTKTSILFLLVLAFVSCKQNTDEPKIELETWDYVFSLADVNGVWKAADLLYDYEIFASLYVTVEKRFHNEQDSQYFKMYTGANAEAYIKTCKVNNKKNKLICPAFGSSVILTKN